MNRFSASVYVKKGRPTARRLPYRRDLLSGKTPTGESIGLFPVSPCRIVLRATAFRLKPSAGIPLFCIRTPNKEEEYYGTVHCFDC